MTDTIRGMNNMRSKLDAEDTSDFAQELTKIINQVMAKNEFGEEQCKLALTRHQIASGAYIPRLHPSNIEDELTSRFGMYPDLTFTVNSDVPRCLLLDSFLLGHIIDDALQKAYIHGKQGGNVKLQVYMSGGDIIVSLINEPGRRHRLHFARQNQATGSGSALDHETTQAVSVMRAKASIYFRENDVVFRLQFCAWEPFGHTDAVQNRRYSSDRDQLSGSTGSGGWLASTVNTTGIHGGDIMLKSTNY